MRCIIRTLIVAGLAGAGAVGFATFAAAKGPEPANPQIDYAGFAALTDELAAYREPRRLSYSAFMAKARMGDVLILDARSADAFARGHLAGAVNLPFTDFTADSLARVIGKRDRAILIYCNNNFSNHEAPVPLKAAPLALNIPTFINLVGYGYHNVYELADVIDFTDPNVAWISSDAES